MHGRGLCGRRHDRIEEPKMEPRGHQCYHRNSHKGPTDVQRCRIQYHDLPARGGSHRDISGGFQSEEKKIRGHIPVESAASHPMSILQGGVNGLFHDGPSQTVAWDRSIDWLELTNSQQDRTSSAGVWGQLPDQDTVMLVSIPKVSRNFPE